MKYRCFRDVIIIALGALISSFTITAVTIDDVLYRFNSDDSVVYNVDYRVSLPFADHDVEYKVSLYCTNVVNDSLCDSNYRIEHTSTNGERGFVSYFNGNFYQYDKNKLREYHCAWDSVPFKPQLGVGVQFQGLFVSLLPQIVSREIKRLRSDDNNTVRLIADTVVKDSKVNIIEIFEKQKGVVLRELLYSFNAASGYLENVEIENNPGMLGEQTIRASYKINNKIIIDTSFYSEAGLIRDYPVEFEKYRVSNFTIENLAGRKLPQFQLPTTTAERYTWDGGFKNPTLIAFLDSNGGMTASTISEIRKAVAEMPVTADILWVFTGNNLDDIWRLMPQTEIQETALIGGRKLSGECGVTGCPTLLFVGKDGVVRDVLIGFNKEMKNVVIQKMTLIQ